MTVNLFCLPFAGGNKYSYRGYANSAPEMLAIRPVELPGRGSRVREKLLVNAQHLADDIFGQIKEHLNRPYAIYGHSMGALLGYLITKRVLRENLRAPRHLFFSGCSAPSFLNEEPPLHHLPQEKFLEEIKNLDGSPEEVLTNETLMSFFVPILRADLQAIETYDYIETKPFHIPMTILIGTMDKITIEQAMGWQKETTFQIDIQQFPGKHFFIYHHERDIISLMREKLAI
jgi:surfactin synthase thioesterase subunit